MSFTKIIAVAFVTLATQNVYACQSLFEDTFEPRLRMYPPVIRIDAILVENVQESQSYVNDQQDVCCDFDSLWDNIKSRFWTIVESQTYHQHHYPAINR